MRNQPLYKRPAIEVYDHCDLVDFFSIWGWKIVGMVSQGLNPQTTNLDLSFLAGAYDLSATYSQSKGNIYISFIWHLFASKFLDFSKDGPWPDLTQAYFWPALN